MDATGAGQAALNAAIGDELEGQIAVIDRHVGELRQAIAQAKRAYPSLAARGALLRVELSYLAIGRLLRGTPSQWLGWRWAVVFVIAMLSWGLVTIISLSFVTGLLAGLVGGGMGACVLYLPDDPHLRSNAAFLRDSLADLHDRKDAMREKVSQLASQLAIEKQAGHRLTGDLERYRHSQQFRLNSLLSQNWKAMRGTELERFLETVFLELHYTVERTGGAGDQGVDLIVQRRDGHRIAVQVKGYLDSVPNTAIQEAFTGMAFHKCNACAVVTNSRFTSGGRNIAASVGCALIDEDRLPMLILGKIDLWQDAVAARATAGSR
ncbi:MAG: restriction endonuclease [Thermoguttaceae bacterium]